MNVVATVGLAAALAIWVTGCATPEQVAEAKAYAREANHMLDDRDVQLRMEQQSRKFFPEVSSAINQAFADGKRIQAPRAVSTLLPNYPLTKQMALTQGAVWVAFVVGPDGTVVDAKAIVDDGARIDPALEESAVFAVKQWTFRPGTIDGTPCKFLFCIPILFQMQF